ncbi:MAG: hypothetical protein R2706_05110 [Acidimicrobiales bacterium]
MEPTKVNQHTHIVVVVAHAFGDFGNELHADVGVVSRLTLPDVVKQRTDNQQVRASDPIGERRHVGGGLAQMTVDGEGMHDVALGSARHVDPFGQ